LSDLIYPPGKSKLFTSKNMMLFWSNFAKYGEPRMSTNNVEWTPIVENNDLGSSFIVLDNKKNLKIISESKSFESLTQELFLDSRLSDLEKCVILLQMFTYVGNDIYDANIKKYSGNCDRTKSENFLIQNASYIEY